MALSPIAGIAKIVPVMTPLTTSCRSPLGVICIGTI